MAEELRTLDTLEGGFFSRLILVNRKPTGVKNARPQITLKGAEALEKWKHDIKKVHEMQGGFIIDPVDSGVKSRAKSWWHNDTSIWEDIKNMKSNTWFKDAMSIAFKIDNKGMLMITMADAWVISMIREAYELHAKNNLWSEKRMDEAFRKAVYRTQPILNSLYTSRFVGSRDIIFKLHHGLYRSVLGKSYYLLRLD